MAIESILIIDDEPLIRRFLLETLQRQDFVVEAVSSGNEALSLLKKKSFDLAITDMKMPGISGLELLRSLKENAPQMIFIVMTAFGTIETAVEAMKIGAFHYLLKPFTPDAIEMIMEKVNEHLTLVHENIYLKEEILNSRTSTKLIAASCCMKKILDEAKRIAKSSASVLIHGESGTGKEVVANAIHSHSLRAKNPYVRVNCSAIPDTLIESEFFGHEKGAFTGAATKRIGRFELAHGGTLLLDEFTEIPIGLQPKLLRVVQERQFERVGGNKPIFVDVRLISTSNRNLKQAVVDKVLREDLFYRLNVIPIHLPPLRERKEDLLPLATYFLERYCHENGKKIKTLTSNAEKKLLNYHWPGNIRELGNVIERVVVLDYGQKVDAEHLILD